MTLPNFVIAGERRCGTTSLANTLSLHRQIFVHDKRDGGYFVDTDVRKGGPRQDWVATHSVADYAALFADAARTGKTAIGEKSADYLFFRPAHARMAAFLPDARFIFILRNPIARAWSHYWNEVGKGRETLSFADAVKSESGRLAKGGYDAYHLSYVTRGFYDESLSDFFKIVPPRRCHVLTLEDLIQTPRAALDGITQFLGIDPFEDVPQRMRSNSNWTMVPKPWASAQPMRSVANGYAAAVKVAANVLRSGRDQRRSLLRDLKRPFFTEASTFKMDSKVQAELVEIFRPHVDRLEILLNRPLPQFRGDGKHQRAGVTP